MAHDTKFWKKTSPITIVWYVKIEVKKKNHKGQKTNTITQLMQERFVVLYCYKTKLRKTYSAYQIFSQIYFVQFSV